MLKERLSRRDESGAVAVMFGLLAVMLMSVAALGVDIGNEVGRHTTTQTQADFAAFAAAQTLDGTGGVGSTPSATVVNAAVTALNANQPQDDKTPPGKPANCVTNKNCVVASDLTDGNLDNGEVRYTSLGLQVTAPRHWVTFGMARIMGFQGSFVGAQATVDVFSPGLRVMPMFAVQGCDYGLQTLADPANGQTPPAVPTLAFNAETNTTVLSQVALTDSTNTVVPTLAYQSTGNKIAVTATKWSTTNYIGFFRGDDPTPSLVQTSAVVPSKSTNGNSSATVTVNIPDAVTQTQAVWYVRVFDGAGNPVTTPHAGSWSSVSAALAIRVGNAVLQCAAGSSDGNFGTLKLPRTDQQPSNWLPVNIANGLQSPLGLKVHATYSMDNPVGQCTDGNNGAHTSPGALGTLVSNTNCVGTDTGLAANVATAGLISGSSPYPGLLTTAGTKTGCDPTGGSSPRSVTIPGKGNFKLDNNVLTCYLLNGSTSLQTVCDPNYNGGPAFDKSLVSDPRFVWVPVLKVQPGQGSSNNYSIVDLRPAFITDEQTTNAAIKGSHTGTPDNGLTIPGHEITQLKVVFFNINALPRDQNEAVIDYLGVGPKITRLIN
jgi:hypothetical protein